MSATSGGGGSVSEGSEAGGSSHSTMSVSDSPSTSFQANLPENVTKITLSEENSANGYGVDLTGSKINLSMDERHQKDGIVNVAFDYEEGTNRGGSGGDFKSINGSEKKDKVPEAVNLELVNMVPYSNGNGTSYGVPVNGIPMKKDSEQVDMNTPYDEYFVPVNEHKKYMRGEKLYVTKDKRRPTSWRRCLSWIVACTVISVVLIVAILAGTGVILSQEPNLVKEASVGRNFAGSNLKPSVTNKSPTPVAEMFMYVPRSIESEFVIDNLDFDPALKDRNSSTYHQFATNLEDQLKMVLFNKETLEFGASDVALKVVNISQDPFKVNYRIGWNYKQGANNPSEPIKMEDVKKRLVESLARNQGYIDKYHIDKEAIKVNHVINTCQMDNGGCSHICYYNYITQQFTCTCPTHLVLDSSGMNCVAWTGSSEDDAVTVPSHTSYPEIIMKESTASPGQEHDFGPHHEHGDHHQEVYTMYDQDGSFQSSSETMPKSNEKEHRDYKFDAESNTEPTAEPDLEKKVKYDGAIIHSSHDTRNDEAAPEPTAEPTFDDKYHDHSIHSVQEPKDSSGESTHQPPAVQNFGNKDHELGGHSVLVSMEHESSIEPTAEPVPESSTAETNFEGRGHDNVNVPKDYHLTAEKDRVHDHDHDYFGQNGKDKDATPEPIPEPAPEPTSDGNYKDKNHDRVDQPIYIKKDFDSTIEPTPEPVPEPTAESNSKSKIHDHNSHSVYEFQDQEPTAEPTSEPAPEPTTQYDTESLIHHQDRSSTLKTKNHELSAEPTPEPSAAFASEGNTHDLTGHTNYEPNQKDHEPTAEPIPESETENKGNDSSIYSVKEPKNTEFSIETTSEPELEGAAKEHHLHSAYESKTQATLWELGSEDKKESEKNTTENSSERSSISEANTELAPEPMPKFSPDSDSSNSEAGEHIEPQMPSNPNSKNASLDSESSLGNSYQESPQRKIPVNETKTEYTVENHPALQNESGLESNSGHHYAPHLEDILIRKPNLNLEGQNTTDQNPLHSVELSTNDGKPVIEEIIINKYAGNSTKQNGLNPASTIINDQTKNESYSDLNKNPLVSENFNNQNIAIKKNLHYGSTESSVYVTEGHDHSGSERNQTEISTDHPKIIEYSQMQYSTPKLENDKETIKQEEFGQSEIFEDKTVKTAMGSSDQNPLLPSQHFNAEDKNYNFKDMTPKTEDQEYKLVNHSQSDVQLTTIHPEIQQEYHTIPVSVEFSNSADIFPNTERKSELENRTEIPEVIDRHQDTSPEQFNLESELTKHQMKNDSSGSQIPKENGLDKMKDYETSTQPVPPMTTFPSIFTSGEFEKITSQHDQDTIPQKQSQSENKTYVKPGQSESNEATKSPEEISNNIKDELLDNEAFNTLIDKEYKNKESTPSEEKELLSKYPNKSLKSDKKKLKDHVKGEKIEPEKKFEVTARPAVTPEDFILQKHVNGNENNFDLEYSLQNEHTTKHDGGVTVIDPQGIPGVSFKSHGVNNYDLSALQTVSPDFKTETVFPSGVQEPETLRPELKTKLLDNKDGEPKLDKDYKFDKDYKYEKQKVSKKKDLKKKVGGKDGKNVELDDGRKYITEINKEDWDVSQENKDIPETTVSPNVEKMTFPLETGEKTLPKSPSEVTAIPVSSVYSENSNAPETLFQPHQNFKMGTEAHGEGITEYSTLQTGDLDKLDLSQHSTTGLNTEDGEKLISKTPVGESGQLIIDEPAVKSSFNASSGIVYDNQFSANENYSNPEVKYVVMNSSTIPSNVSGIRGTSGMVFDKLPEGTKIDSSGFGNQDELRRNTTFNVYKATNPLPDIILESEVTNTTTAHPTIVIHGQSGNLHDGHMKFINSTAHNPGNETVLSAFNGTLSHPDGQFFTLTNYTSTFPNGTSVHPTIVIRGQSGALQDGHESRFGNSTFHTFTTFSPHSTDNRVFKNSQVYRIENSSLPDTVFDGHFNPQEGHFHMFTNSSGTFVYTNTSTQPVFKIRGESGDFGNSTAYILENSTSSVPFSGSFVGPNSVIFRNSTVFAVENIDGNDPVVREMTVEPHSVTSKEKIHFTHQMSPSFVSSGTAYKVNNYFGYISKCAAGQFQCVNGTSKRGSPCINLSSKCDSINDCSDGSDESGCVENGCPGNFQCSDNTCLKRNLVCNGILDCSDGSDEKNCESWKCEFDEFQCPSGRCIPVVWQCDNKPDCDNHTDEYNCQTSCGNDEYLCPEGWCIPLTYKCNGVKECTNGEDEQLCDCSYEEFKCQTGGCVSKEQVCNGLDDCPDRSDEWGCVKIDPDSNLLKIRSPSGNYEPVCADNWSTQYSDEVCASLGYFSSVPIENENSSITTETSFYSLKNDTTADFNSKIIVNLRKSEGNCSSGKFVEISCQEFSCGSRSMTDSSSVEARLVGGMSATTGQWPSVALLYNIRNFHSCTANVLTPKWVLASYNCLKMGNFRNKNLNEQDWQFFGGSTVFEAEKENAETRKILSIIPHPQVKFNQFLFTNDLALVELNQSLQFTSNLGAVCLPEQEMQPRQICVTAGWGMNSPEDKAIRQQLQYLPVPTMNLTECNSTEHYSGFITDDKICAGYNSAQKSLCYNEEGAPLMCVNDRGEWELQGVLSYHSNCGRGSHPSIFSSITPVTEWIKKTIGNNFERKSLTVTNR